MFGIDVVAPLESTQLPLRHVSWRVPNVPHDCPGRVTSAQFTLSEMPSEYGTPEYKQERREPPTVLFVLFTAESSAEKEDADASVGGRSESELVVEGFFIRNEGLSACAYVAPFQIRVASILYVSGTSEQIVPSQGLAPPICAMHVIGLFAHELVLFCCPDGTFQKYAPLARNPVPMSPRAMFAVARSSDRETVASTGAFSVFHAIANPPPSNTLAPDRGSVNDIRAEI